MSIPCHWRKSRSALPSSTLASKADNYQPAGNASPLAAGRSGVHRECAARFATLRFVRSGGGVSDTFGIGVLSMAKASRGGLVTGASATSGGICETIVGALMSKTTRSGHLWSDFIAIIGLSASPPVAVGVRLMGSSQSAMNNTARSRLPTKTR
jgi:hypothetical protein